MVAREPGDDDDRAEVEDDEALVPLGEIHAEVDRQRAAAAQEAAKTLLATSRAPPSAMDAERALLGALMLEPTVFDEVVDEGVEPADFYRPAHGLIFAVITDLRLAAEPVDTLTVTEELQKRGKLDNVGGAAAISQLEAMLPTAAHAASYARLVREKAVARRLIEKATRLVAVAYEQRLPAAELLELAQQSFLDVVVGRHHDVADRARLVREIVARIGLTGRAGLPTGWRDLDSGLLQRGLRGGQLIIVGARPAMGKSVFGHQLAAQVADMQGVPTAFLTLEMSPEELLEREIAAKARAATSTWERVHHTSSFKLAVGRVAERQLHLVHCPGATLSAVASQVRRLVARGVGLVVVDYLGLVVGTGENRTQQVGMVSRGLKALAGQLNIPIVALSQLNRAVETRTDKRPTMADLRDTGDIEQDADVIAFLHRPEYYMKEKTPADLLSIAEVIIEKQRNGPTGIAKLWFQGEETRFRNIAVDGGAAA